MQTKQYSLVDFQGMRNNTGHVPMKLLVDAPPYRKGKVIGMAPDVACRFYNAGEAELASAPGVRASEPPAAAHPMSGLGQQPKKKGPTEAEYKDPEIVEQNIEIPEDWDKMHHMIWSQMAAKITGKKPEELVEEARAKDVMPKAYNKAIIEAEVARRAAEKPAEQPAAQAEQPAGE